MSRRPIINTSFIALASVLAICSSAQADCSRPCAASEASELSALAIASVMQGSIQAVAASNHVVVESIEAVGNGFIIVLKSASEGIKTSVRISSAALRGVAIAVGTSVQLVASTTGYMLLVAGKAIAFIPNTIGTGLLYQSRVQ